MVVVRQEGCTQSKPSVDSDERPDLEVPNMNGKPDAEEVVLEVGEKKRKRRAWKRREVDHQRRGRPLMWQELWLAKYTWDEGEFINGIFVAMIYTICPAMEGLKMSIISKNENLVKH